jgi:hypothetical protein
MYIANYLCSEMIKSGDSARNHMTNERRSIVNKWWDPHAFDLKSVKGC